MFGEITKILDRDFAVGYFLPSVLFSCGSLYLVMRLAPGALPRLGTFIETEPLSALGLVALGSWLLAIWLVAGNRRIIRLKEGYGWWNGPWNPFEWRKKRQMRRLLEESAQLADRVQQLSKHSEVPFHLQAEMQHCRERLVTHFSSTPSETPPWWGRTWNPFRALQLRGFRSLTAREAELRSVRQELLRRKAPVPPDLERELIVCRRRLVTRFPDTEASVLPTAFGNTIRAFERYVPLMYGFGSILGWCRLMGVIPLQFREQVDGAKAQVDFLLNIWFLSHLLLFEWAYLVWPWNHVEIPWFPVLALMSAGLASYWARDAAVNWGEMIKASFDLYLPDLREKLGLPQPSSRAAEKEQWTHFSQAILFRHQQSLPELAAEAEDTPGSGEPLHDKPVSATREPSP